MRIRFIYLGLTLILFMVSCSEQDDDQISGHLETDQRDSEVSLEGQGVEELEPDEELEGNDREGGVLIDGEQTNEEQAGEEQAGEEQAGEELTVIPDREASGNSSPDLPDQPDQSTPSDSPDSSNSSNSSDSSDFSDPPDDASTASVLCGEETCNLATHTCCLREFGASCVEGVNATCDLGGTPLICDGPEDCGGGQCCLSVGLPGALECSPTSCVNLTLCHVDSECAEDQICRQCQFTGLTLSVCSRPNVIPNLALSCE